MIRIQQGWKAIYRLSWVKIGVGLYITLTVLALLWGVLRTVDDQNLRDLARKNAARQLENATLQERVDTLSKHASSLEGRLVLKDTWLEVCLRDNLQEVLLSPNSLVRCWLYMRAYAVAVEVDS